MKKIISAILAVTLVFGMAASLAGCGGKDDDSASVIRVGSKDFTENLIVAELYALALEDAGYTVERDLDIAGSMVHTAITSDEIDLYPEYTGTGLLSVLQMDMESDPDVVYNTVKEAYDEQFDITWLTPTEINDRQGIAIRTDVAEEYGIHNMSQLQQNADKLRMCSQGEFEYREDGLTGLAKVYGEFNFKSINVYDNGIKYEILKNDEADVCPGYSTDAQLVDKDSFTYLEDDKGFWPPYYLAPIIRNELLEANPEIADVLNAVSAKLDTETIVARNAKVDIEQMEYEDVAREFYETVCK